MILHLFLYSLGFGILAVIFILLIIWVTKSFNEPK